MRATIVGAGPAGIGAAEILVAHGANVTVIDEGRAPGGQIYRRARPGLSLDVENLLGAEAANYHRFHASFERLRERIDYRPHTLAWGIEGQTVHVTNGNLASTITSDALILATGATDRTMPLPGWTLPGVFTLGGAQVLLKEHGCLIGKRVVFCGSSPLLYLAAKQYRQMGADVVAVLDTTPFATKASAATDLFAAPRVFMRGIGYMRGLRAAGVEIGMGVQLIAFNGTSGVESVRYRDAKGREVTIACDAVAYGYGLKPEVQLAELAGAGLRYDPVFRQWLPDADGDGRCGNRLYVAGDGATVGGAEAAAITGRLAACAVLEDAGMAISEIDRGALRRSAARLRRFQHGLARAFAWPISAVASLADDVMVCRCEGIRAGELRHSLRENFGPSEINRLKAITRCGMGRCQGRFCGLAAAELMAHELKVPLEAVGRLRAQPPIKPIPLSVSLAESVQAAALAETSAPA